MASLEEKINEIIIEDGSKTYEIKNRQGKKLAEFCFRPADTNILARYEDVRNSLMSLSFRMRMTL